MYVRRYRKKFGYRKKRVFPKKRVYKRKTSFKRRVVKIVEKTIETKHANSQITDATVAGILDAGTAATQIIPLTPYGSYIQIAQGTADGYRIGNKIRTASCSFKYTFFPNPYNATTNALVKPHMMLMFLLRDKKHPAYIPDIADLTSNLYNAGSTTVAATGTVKDLTFALNTDRFQVFKRWTHKIAYQTAAVQGVVAGNEYFANNDFKMFVNKTVYCTKHCHKVFDFDDNSFYPSTPGVFLFFYPVFVDGSNIALGQYPTQMNLAIDFKYKDA